MLTGVPAGILDSNGSYPDNTVHGLVMAKLKTYHDAYSADKKENERIENAKDTDEEF